jgi:hypothetical protein
MHPKRLEQHNGKQDKENAGGAAHREVDADVLLDQYATTVALWCVLVHTLWLPVLLRLRRTRCLHRRQQLLDKLACLFKRDA